jgi:hypothetical protein
MRNFFTLLFHVHTYQSENPIHQSEKVEWDSEKEIEAPERCVENILNFARSYRVAESKSTGKIELILN